MDKKVLWVVLALLIVAAGAWLFLGGAEPQPAANTDENPEVTPTVTPAEEVPVVDESENTPDGPDEPLIIPVELSIDGSNYKFSQNEIRVKKGALVKINFRNVEGFHDLRIDGYNVGTAKLQTGQSETFEFTADTAGTFEFYCSVGQHRANGMKGNLIVE